MSSNLMPTDPSPVDAPDAFATVEEEQPFTGYPVAECLDRQERTALFAANDERLGRDVMVRALLPDPSRDDAIERFFSEARNVARLRDPRVTRGLDVGRGGDFFFFVSEAVRGERLAGRLARLERGRLTEAIAVGIVRDIAEALQTVFENGLAHRWLRPESIWLTEEKGARLADLGIAFEVAYPDDTSAFRSQPTYLSPEQALDEPTIDIRADLYALGCIWFHMLVGHPPFRGASTEAVLRGHVESPAPNPREINVRISAASSELVRLLMSKDREERPRTPEAFLSRLRTHPLLAEEDSA